MDAGIIIAIITAISAVIVSIINGFFASRKASLEGQKTRKLIEENGESSSRSQKLQQEALMQLLGKEIDDDYYKYKAKGYIPVNAKKNLEAIMKVYKDLGGNGQRDSEWIFIDGLPVKEDE